jgi:hypothetical protein
MGLCIPLTLQSNNWANTFQRQQRNIGTPFSVRSVSHQRKVGDKFFPKLLVSFCVLSQNNHTSHLCTNCSWLLSLHSWECLCFSRGRPHPHAAHELKLGTWEKYGVVTKLCTLILSGNRISRPEAYTVNLRPWCVCCNDSLGEFVVNQHRYFCNHCSRYVFYGKQFTYIHIAQDSFNEFVTPHDIKPSQTTTRPKLFHVMRTTNRYWNITIFLIQYTFYINIHESIYHLHW